MTNKDWKEELGKRLNWTVEQLDEVMQHTIEEIAAQLSAGEQLVIDGLGIFTTRKQKERIVIHAETKERRLMPPAIEVMFASTITKQVLEEESNNQMLSQSIATTAEIESDSAARYFHQLIQFIAEQMHEGIVVEYPDLGVFTPVIDRSEEGTIVHVNFVATGLLHETVNKPFSHFEPVVLGEGVSFEGVEEIIESDLEEEELEAKQPIVSKIKETIAIAAEQLSDEKEQQPIEKIEEPEVLEEQMMLEVSEDLREPELSISLIGEDEAHNSSKILEQPETTSTFEKKSSIKSDLKQMIDRYPVLMPIIGGIAVAVVGFFFSFTRRK